MQGNHMYNLMAQLVEEQKSAWRIAKMYLDDAGDCPDCRPFWEKLYKDKEDHIKELTALIKKHLE